MHKHDVRTRTQSSKYPVNHREGCRSCRHRAAHLCQDACSGSCAKDCALACRWMRPSTSCKHIAYQSIYLQPHCSPPPMLGPVSSRVRAESGYLQCKTCVSRHAGNDGIEPPHAACKSNADEQAHKFTFRQAQGHWPQCRCRRHHQGQRMGATGPESPALRLLMGVGGRWAGKSHHLRSR